MTNKEFNTIYFSTKLSTITDFVDNIINEMVEKIIADKKALKANDGTLRIPLSNMVREFDDYKELLIDPIDHEDIDILSISLPLTDLSGLIIEIKIAVMTALAQQYFDVEDI